MKRSKTIYSADGLRLQVKACIVPNWKSVDVMVYRHADGRNRVDTYFWLTPNQAEAAAAALKEAARIVREAKKGKANA